MNEKEWTEVSATPTRKKHAQRRAYIRRHMPKNGDKDYEAMANEMQRLGYYSAKSTIREIKVSIASHVVAIEEEDSEEAAMNSRR